MKLTKNELEIVEILEKEHVYQNGRYSEDDWQKCRRNRAVYQKTGI